MPTTDELFPGLTFVWVGVAGKILGKIDGLAPGTRLPTQKDLAAEFGCSHQVVARAMSELSGLGIININGIGQQHRGYWVK